MLQLYLPAYSSSVLQLSLLFVLVCFSCLYFLFWCVSTVSGVVLVCFRCHYFLFWCAPSVSLHSLDVLLLSLLIALVCFSCLFYFWCSSAISAYKSGTLQPSLLIMLVCFRSWFLWQLPHCPLPLGPNEHSAINAKEHVSIQDFNCNWFREQE